MPAALPGMCPITWTLSDVASAGSAGGVWAAAGPAAQSATRPTSTAEIDRCLNPPPTRMGGAFPTWQISNVTTVRLCVMVEGQEGVTWDEWVALARATEELGFDALFRSD